MFNDTANFQEEYSLVWLCDVNQKGHARDRLVACYEMRGPRFYVSTVGFATSCQLVCRPLARAGGIAVGSEQRIFVG